MTHRRKLPTLIVSITVTVMMQNQLLGQSQVPASKPDTGTAGLKTRSEPITATSAPTIESPTDPLPGNTIQAGRILRVALDRPLLKLSKLRSGSELDGQVMRTVFLGDKTVNSSRQQGTSGR